MYSNPYVLQELINERRDDLRLTMESARRGQAAGIAIGSDWLHRLGWNRARRPTADYRA